MKIALKSDRIKIWFKKDIFIFFKLPVCKDFENGFYDENRSKKEINIVEYVIIIIWGGFITHGHGDYIQYDACWNKVFYIVAFT